MQVGTQSSHAVLWPYGAGTGAEAQQSELAICSLDDFTYDFSWEVLKFTISTSHFMLCFEHLTKKVSIFWSCVRRICRFSSTTELFELEPKA